METPTLTPMLKQYQTIKAQHKDCILFFRLGDFYEMFYEDAKEASQILDVVLTSRGKGQASKVPMCGIPYHAGDTYIARLIKAGKKVAICEQVEDPALAKGIVKRDVVRVITSGTYIDENTNDPRYILAITLSKNTVGCAFTDTTGGMIRVNEYDGPIRALEAIAKLPVYECIYPANDEEEVKHLFTHPLIAHKNISFSACEDWYFNPTMAEKTLCEHFKMHNMRGFGLENMPHATTSAGALLEYLRQMNKQPMHHMHAVSVYSDTEYVFISPAACYGLELESLLKTLDGTLTSLGKRLFRMWLFHPLKDISRLQERQQAVRLLKEKASVREDLTRLLKHMPDIEKHLSRISCGYTSARDLLALRNALIRIPEIRSLVLALSEKNDLFTLHDDAEIRTLLERAVNPELPLSKPEGKTIKKGYDTELDALRGIQEHGRDALKKMQESEIRRTGINSLKIGYNKVFGYYIEISKTNLPLVPNDYIRKQTLVNAERFITPELKEFEEKILTAEEKIARIETRLIEEIAQTILQHSRILHEVSTHIATIDCLYALSTLALRPGYIEPKLVDDDSISIQDGRHPVVETYSPDPFVPNDTLLDSNDNHLLIITGPNMAGKSTYIRQTAILVIMAQMGSFIPAITARIGLVDKIFTRIGAHDEISKGQSTFMVEMSEAAGILNNLSPRSLVILDEIGRGTSTYDGLSLAWAIAEYLHKKKVRTLFATHFHELTALQDECRGVKNYNVDVKEWNDQVIFLHKIVPGGTDDSYGIYVAKLAGIPTEVLERSRHILHKLEFEENLRDKLKTSREKDHQLSLFAEKTTVPEGADIIDELKSLEINTLTPLDALNTIHQWHKKVGKK